MAITTCAQDILKLLPGSLLDIDLPNEITVVLGVDMLSDAILQEVYTLFGDASEGAIDFENKTLSVTRQRITFKQLRAVKSGLVGTTESERAAVTFADELDVIDYDRLVPTFAMSSSSAGTVLRIQNLLRVSHNALIAQLPPTCSCAYDIENGEVRVTFPTVNKRKR